MSQASAVVAHRVRSGVQGSRSVVPAHERAALQLQPGAATAVHTSVRFKRNVAQAPNPLSAKKKRKATQSQPPQMQTKAGSREEVRVVCSFAPRVTPHSNLVHCRRRGACASDRVESGEAARRRAGRLT